MCLTGVDYFSTLGYQPGIAFLAAGIISPLATLVLVLLTLFGALPMYNRVAVLSPHGQGSISVLEELLPRWRGKLLVLILLGFAATGFIITITLSAADATAHVIENPLVPRWMDHPVALTLVLLAALGAVFLKGFREAVGLAVPIVAVYLVLNAVVVGWGLIYLAGHPDAFGQWSARALADYGSPTSMVIAALLVFPKLALGLSGFETGVAVMPLVKGDPGDTEERPTGRIRNTRKLLTVAALIMSGMLVGSSIVTTTLIPPEAFRPVVRPTVAHSPTSPTITWATRSVLSTTSAPSPFSGSPAPRRWLGCSISCRSTCRATAWRPSGRRRTVRSCSSSPPSRSWSRSSSEPT